uniref:Uncharacterized protein n=1 Tax=viral metagenome TaxID=1070528 RepID=A0A6M3XKF2_9ZZZZ
MARYKFTQESGTNFKVNTTDKADAIEDTNEVRQILDDLGELLGHSKFDDAYPADATSGGDIDIRRVTTKSAVATLTTGEAGFVKVSAAAGYTLTLPTAVGNKLTYIFVKTDANTNLITIDGAGTETINGSLTYTDLNYQYAYVAIRSDNANWFVLYSSKVIAPTINLTGGQIAFPATAAPSAGANTLDDYEEGTWTIGISFGGGVTGITYVASTGYYTKMGNIVNISGNVELTSKGTDTGAAKITGLPFTSGAISTASFRLYLITFADRFSGYTEGTTIVLEETTNAGALSAITNADFANGSQIVFSCAYRI